ncbi:MAG: hypothetical protein KJ607_09570, partial [Bacteroidetes bacterium]|nr:hypothetical protein [Bacteroidota bacterium]
NYSGNMHQRDDKLIFIKPKDLARISNLSVRQARAKIRLVKDACSISNRDITLNEYCTYFSIEIELRIKMMNLI